MRKDTEEDSRLFSAVVDRNKYMRAYTLYRDENFTAMKAEHDKYVGAVRVLKEAGYETDTQIQALIDRQSEVEFKRAQFTSDIRHFRHEIKMCDQALQLNRHIQAKKEVMEHIEQGERMNLDEPKR